MRFVLRGLPGLLLDVCIYGYLAGLLFARLARGFWGDQFWWLILANCFAPWMFLVAPIGALGAIAARRGQWVVTAAWLPVLMFGVLYGPRLLPPPGTNPAEAATLRLLTYNVLGTSDESARIVHTVIASDADVVAIQELNPVVASDLQAALRDAYPFQALHPRNGVSGLGVFSKLPMQDRGERRLRTWENWAQEVVIEWDGRPLTLFNLHGEPVARTAPTLRRSLAAFEQSFRAQEAQTRELLMHAEALDGPIVFAGDFNRGDENVTHGWITAQYRDAFSETGQGFGHTFPSPSGRAAIGRLGSFPFSVRIDYVYYSPELESIDSRVADWDGVSDHYAVSATLVWNE